MAELTDEEKTRLLKEFTAKILTGGPKPTVKRDTGEVTLVASAASVPPERRNMPEALAGQEDAAYNLKMRARGLKPSKRPADYQPGQIQGVRPGPSGKHS